LKAGIRIKAGFGAGFALLLGICYAAIQQTKDWDQTAQALARTHLVIERLEDLSLQSTQAEVAARRFIATPGASDPARCRESLRRAIGRAQELNRLVAGNAAQTGKMQAVSRLVAQQAEGILRSLPSETASGPAVAADAEKVRTALAALDNAQLSDNLRSTTIAMEAEAIRLLNEHTLQQQKVVSVSRILSLIASAFSAGLILLVGWRVTLEQKNRGKIQRSLQMKEEQYQRVVELAGDIICRTDTQGRFTLCNQAALDLLHFGQTEVIGRSWLRFVRQDKRTAAGRFYRRQIGRRLKSTYYEMPLIDGHGGERWVALNVQLVIENDQVAGLQAIARDVTFRKKTEAERQRSRKFIERVTATTPGVLYVYDLVERRNVYCNREVLSVLGYKPEDMPEITNLPKEFYHPDDQAMIEAQRAALRQVPDGEIRRLEYRVRHASGQWVWLSVQETAFERGPDGLVKQVVGISQDITMRRGAQDRLPRLAGIDSLTGVRTRQHFWNGLQSALRQASIDHLGTSLCLFDVDNFQEINDRFGPAAGDEVLESIGSILRAELRAADLAGRLGDDRFCFALPRTTSEECARVAERVRGRLSAVAFGVRAGTPFFVTATFGVAESDPDVNARELMDAADRALYRAKSEGRNRVTVEAA
jgi:diguanylate cyclase (GGDEF)-like protein/PAS domain S-box-containing protein